MRTRPPRARAARPMRSKRLSWPWRPRAAFARAARDRPGPPAQRKAPGAAGPSRSPRRAGMPPRRARNSKTASIGARSGRAMASGWTNGDRRPAEEVDTMAELFYDKQADVGRLAGRPVAIIGFGSQGHAHALNLQESGLDVRVGLYEGSRTWAKAE